MTKGEVMLRMNLVREALFKREPALTIQEATQFLNAVSEAVQEEKHRLFDTVEEEVTHLVSIAEKKLGWGISH